MELGGGPKSWCPRCREGRVTRREQFCLSNFRESRSASDHDLRPKGGLPSAEQLVPGIPQHSGAQARATRTTANTSARSNLGLIPPSPPPSERPQGAGRHCRRPSRRGGRGATPRPALPGRLRSAGWVGVVRRRSVRSPTSYRSPCRGSGRKQWPPPAPPPLLPSQTGSLGGGRGREARRAPSPPSASPAANERPPSCGRSGGWGLREGGEAVGQRVTRGKRFPRGGGVTWGSKAAPRWGGPFH